MTAQALAEDAGPRNAHIETPDSEVFRHRLHVIAASSVDVVCSAGGWLADRALAGWDVLVYLPDDQDPAPLRVLGLAPRSMGQLSDLAQSFRRERRGKRRNAPAALAVDAAMVSGHSLVTSCIERAFADATVEILMWGAVPVDALGERFVRTPCRASTAGRAFKSHALSAAAVAQRSSDIEEVHIRAPQPSWVGCFVERGEPR
ncbi:hypothetical protein FPV58_15160 [Mycolicibacterium porcinum]|uniref:hypothetical protein n=1 Tax=Mycolicibacterium porcinum TaxID=39693 RepID=UPI00118FB84D|nr:hypothetical protein [Mycolicibacterium porcinum]TVY00848.1 hypothetical protein FPV58_15160 [Mycolicibacterium porcinum]